jgi:hypothetical protein
MHTVTCLAAPSQSQTIQPMGRESDGALTHANMDPCTKGLAAVLMPTMVSLIAKMVEDCWIKLQSSAVWEELITLFNTSSFSLPFTFLFCLVFYVNSRKRGFLFQRRSRTRGFGRHFNISSVDHINGVFGFSPVLRVDPLEWPAAEPAKLCHGQRGPTDRCSRLLP